MLQVRSLAWALPMPLSREVVLPVGNQLELAGGLDAGGASTDAVVLLNPSTGVSRRSGRLATAVHDAAGAVVGGHGFVLGGGSTNSVAAVQRLVSGGVAVSAASLPRPRSDLVAVGVDDGALVLGGYDGAELDPTILKTTDGTTFVSVGSLAVPVRYPAVAVLGDTLWVFGGEAASGASDVIQRVDLGSGRSRIAGRLPSSLTGAAAVVLGGRVFLCGGMTSTGASTAIRRFDPVAVRTTLAGHLPGAVSEAGSAVVAGIGYLLGGENPAPSSLVVQLRFVPAVPASHQGGQ